MLEKIVMVMLCVMALMVLGITITFTVSMWR